MKILQGKSSLCFDFDGFYHVLNVALPLILNKNTKQIQL
jgi:hypothetical protein